MCNFRNQLLMKIEWIQLESVQKKLLMKLLKPQIWNLMIQLNVIITFKNYVFSSVCVKNFLCIFNVASKLFLGEKKKKTYLYLKK